MVGGGEDGAVSGAGVEGVCGSGLNGRGGEDGLRGGVGHSL